MKIKIFTSLPEFFDVADLSILGRSLKSGLWSLELINIKEYGITGYKQIDDTPYGGGAGMILRADVIGQAIEKNIDFDKKPKVVLTSPRGAKFDQKMAEKFAKLDELHIICSRFEGVDQRVIDFYNLEEVSIGDYVLFGGEVAALTMIEAIVRLIPGVIPSHDSEDSFCGVLEGKLEYDHYTRPAIWKDMSVPEVLTSGNHAEIKKWRLNNAKHVKN